MDLMNPSGTVRKKLGRPVTGLARKHSVMVRLNDAELGQLTEAAHARGTVLSVFLRLATLELLAMGEVAGELKPESATDLAPF